MKTLQTAATVLMEARELIEKGWCQGSYHVSGDPDLFSPVGAICHIEGNAPIKSGAHDYFQLAITDPHPRWSMPPAVSFWNDEPSRTKEEVLAAFDRAFEIAKDRK